MSGGSALTLGDAPEAEGRNPRGFSLLRPDWPPKENINVQFGGGVRS